MKKAVFIILIIFNNSLNAMTMNDIPGALRNFTSQLDMLSKFLKQLSSPPPFPPRPIKQPEPQPGIQPKPSPQFPEKKPVTVPEKEKIRPLKSITKKPIVDIPPIKIATILQLDTGYIQPLLGMPATKPLEKARKMAQAKGILNALLGFVQSTKYNATQQAQIKKAINTILSIDPLLISTAAIVSRKAGIPISENYKQMTDYYKKQIEYIAKELDAVIKRNGTSLHEGVREDIDEAFSYPIELEGEIQEANIIIELKPNTDQAREAKFFINIIKELKEWLIELLKESNYRTILQNSGLDVDFYLSTLEQKTNRVYCITQVGPQFGNNKYVHFIDDLREIILDIENYKQGEANFSKSMKTYQIQNIINKLKGFLTHATESTYCQICLQDDISEIRNTQNQGTFNVDETFKKITQFLQQIYNKEKNEAIKRVYQVIIPQLKNAFSQKGCPIQE